MTLDAHARGGTGVRRVIWKIARIGRHLTDTFVDVGPFIPNFLLQVPALLPVGVDPTHQSEGICVRDWISIHICIRVGSASQSNWITLDVPPERRIIIPEVVVM